jgi:hypothetical protein
MTQPQRYQDRILLVVTALFVYVTGVGAFWLAELRHVSPVWVFFLWNSIALVALFIDDLRTHLNKLICCISCRMGHDPRTLRSYIDALVVYDSDAPVLGHRTYLGLFLRGPHV